MHLRRALLLTVLVALIPATVLGTGSFSAVNADRGFDVSVATDENAYIGVEVEPAEGFVGGDPVPVLRLTDQFSGTLVLESVTTTSSLVAVETETPADIGVGDAVTVRVTCRAAGSEGAPFSIEAADQTTSAVIDRTVPITCIEPDVQRVRFDGCGNALIEADDAIYPLTVTKEVDDPSTDGVSRTTVTVDSDGKVGPGQGGKLVAIEADGERYENQNACADESASDDAATATTGTQ